MFTACFDASGDSHCQPVLAMGGFVASTDAWIEWESDWLARLAQEDLEYFHRNEISRWPRHRIDGLVNDLCAITKQYVSGKAGIVVINRDLQEHIPEQQRKQWHIVAYRVTGKCVAKEMRLWSAQWGGRLPELVFEEGDDGKGKLIDLLTGDGYPPPIFKPKRTYTHRKSRLQIAGAAPLQAADMYAYLLLDRARRLLADEDVSPNFNRLQDELDRITGAAGIISEPYLKFIDHGLSQRDDLIMTANVKIKLN